MSGTTGIFFWGFLIVYGVIMIAISPKKVTVDGFFKGQDSEGKSASPLVLTSSIFISWIFAKSVTNAANLGQQYGIVGGFAYATYWLCIPLAGVAIYRLRKKYNATGLVDFLTENYGKAAAFSFSAAIFIRLFNEIWSNSAVIGGYYGASGTKPFIIAAVLFTIITLIYSMRGGLRSSLITDAIQSILFIVIMVFIIAWIVPKHPISQYLTEGSWKMDAGVDMLLVSALQILSYPFHDPVLTDRGFICEEKTMLKAFVISGILGFLAILIFSFIGIDARISGMAASDNVPAMVAQSMSILAFFFMAVLMISAAGSTLDSTFSSLAKLSARDIPNIIGKDFGNKAKTIGIIVMIIFAILGNRPMIVGTNILKATTISGTMVMGLAPIFLLHGVVKPTKLGFHLSFWIGIVLGVLITVNMIPSAWAIGNGENALLLGVNLYGLILCTIGYIVPGILARKK